jgi:hypothetical protein
MAGGSVQVGSVVEGEGGSSGEIEEGVDRSRLPIGRREWLQVFVMQPTNHNNNTTGTIIVAGAGHDKLSSAFTLRLSPAPRPCPEAVGQHCAFNARQSV